jgi:hypothetical protein
VRWAISSGETPFELAPAVIKASKRGCQGRQVLSARLVGWGRRVVPANAGALLAIVQASFACQHHDRFVELLFVDARKIETR